MQKLPPDPSFALCRGRRTCAVEICFSVPCLETSMMQTPQGKLFNAPPEGFSRWVEPCVTMGMGLITFCSRLIAAWLPRMLCDGIVQVHGKPFLTMALFRASKVVFVGQQPEQFTLSCSAALHSAMLHKAICLLHALGTYALLPPSRSLYSRRIFESASGCLYPRLTHAVQQRCMTILIATQWSFFNALFRIGCLQTAVGTAFTVSVLDGARYCWSR